MRTKFVTVKVSYDTEETWELTIQEVKEILQMMNNLKRNAIIVEIEQGVNNDDGQNEWTARRIAGYDSKIKQDINDGKYREHSNHYNNSDGDTMKEIGMKQMEKKIKMLEAEIESLYKENEHLVKMYKAIQELQEQHDAPASKFTYYLGW